MSGWVKIHRSILQKGYYKDSNYVHLWLHLILRANHEGREFMWNGKIQRVERGQLLTGRKELASETGIDRSKIERIIKTLISEHQIEQQTYSKFRLITLINYDKWQSSEQENEPQVSSKRAAGEHKQELKELKNRRSNTGGASPPPVRTFNPQGTEIIKAFEALNPACKNYYGNPPQRKACDQLIETYTLPRVLTVIGKTLPKTNLLDYFPRITTPYQLWEKWSQLESQIKAKQLRPANENNIAFK